MGVGYARAHEASGGSPAGRRGRRWRFPAPRSGHQRRHHIPRSVPGLARRCGFVVARPEGV